MLTKALLWFALTERQRSGSSQHTLVTDRQDQLERMHHNVTIEKARLLEDLRNVERERAVAYTQAQGHWDAQLRVSAVLFSFLRTR